MTKQVSIAIIGGGPVGLYLANKLSEQNILITIFEKKTWPVDKVCGQGVMPSGVERLQEIGVKLTSENSYPFAGIRYIDDKISLRGDLAKKALGIERSVLSTELLKILTTRAHISMLENVSVTDIVQIPNQQIEIRTSEDVYHFDYAFCCDGMHSPTRDQLGLTKTRSGIARLGARIHYDISPWDDTVQVYWSQGLEAYVTPVSSTKIEVAYLWYEDAIEKGALLEERLLKHFPDLESKLDPAKKLSDFKAYGPFKKYSAKVNKGNVYFIGDAFHFKDGITGEGVSLGFKASDIIAENFQNFKPIHALHIYILYLNYSFWIFLSLQMSKFPRFRKLVLKLASFSPKVFNTCLNLNDNSFKFIKRFY